MAVAFEGFSPVLFLLCCCFEVHLIRLEEAMILASFTFFIHIGVIAQIICVSFKVSRIRICK